MARDDYGWSDERGARSGGRDRQYREHSPDRDDMRAGGARYDRDDYYGNRPTEGNRSPGSNDTRLRPRRRRSSAATGTPVTALRRTPPCRPPLGDRHSGGGIAPLKPLCDKAGNHAVSGRAATQPAARRAGTRAPRAARLWRAGSPPGSRQQRVRHGLRVGDRIARRGQSSTGPGQAAMRTSASPEAGASRELGLGLGGTRAARARQPLRRLGGDGYGVVADGGGVAAAGRQRRRSRATVSATSGATGRLRRHFGSGFGGAAAATSGLGWRSLFSGSHTPPSRRNTASARYPAAILGHAGVARRWRPSSPGNRRVSTGFGGFAYRLAWLRPPGRGQSHNAPGGEPEPRRTWPKDGGVPLAGPGRRSEILERHTRSTPGDRGPVDNG